MNKPYFNALVASLGSALEYFSFITFALQAQYLAALFFPQDPSVQGILNTFLIFAVGSLVTVFGGIFFGYFGDRLGRKRIFSYAILLMSLSTMGIAITPSGFGIIGLTALIIFRILQGISQGAELPGAITFIIEHAHHKNRGTLCGFMFLGVGLGAGLATAVNVLLSKIFSFEEMLHFGWRIPFFFASTLGFIGFIQRKKMSETPLFLASQKVRFSFKIKILPILHGFGLVLLGSTLVSLGLYWPILLTNIYHFDVSDVFFAMMLGFTVTTFFLPIFGYAGDRFGQGKIYLIGTLLTLISLPFLFRLLDLQSLSYLVLFSLIYYTLITILAGNYPVMIAELYPTQNRYFSVALAYMGCYALTSFSPALAAFLFLHGGNIKELIFCIEITGLLSLIAGFFYCRRSTFKLSTHS